MAEYQFDSSDSLEDTIPDGETVTNIKYNGDTQIVETSDDPEILPREELEKMNRSQLYDYADDIGIQVNWSGDNADTKDDMLKKILD